MNELQIIEIRHLGDITIEVINIDDDLTLFPCVVYVISEKERHLIFFDIVNYTNYFKNDSYECKEFKYKSQYIDFLLNYEIPNKS